MSSCIWQSGQGVTRQVAPEAAAQLDADLIDDNQRQLTESGINTIRHQLQQLYSRMDDRGIAPGSVAALRLFA